MFFFANREMLRKLIVFVAVMFAFGFALVPIYKKICEVTGVNDFMKPEQLKNTQVDQSRSIKVEFDANTRGLPWSFKPEFSTLTVHPGELTTVMYTVQNTTTQDMVGQAIPSYGPSQAAEHFKKLECFCFAKQTFAAQETRQMPVVFVIDPALPKDINTIALSYTFFEIPGAAVPPAARTPAGKFDMQSPVKANPG
jgi:cytochrome c oxidase assembly protein subunit 11